MTGKMVLMKCSPCAMHCFFMQRCTSALRAAQLRCTTTVCKSGFRYGARWNYKFMQVKKCRHVMIHWVWHAVGVNLARIQPCSTLFLVQLCKRHNMPSIDMFAYLKIGYQVTMSFLSWKCIGASWTRAVCRQTKMSYWFIWSDQILKTFETLVHHSWLQRCFLQCTRNMGYSLIKLICLGICTS